MPKVSICSSILNQVDLARGMIASVIGQSFQDWELIIVDDGSTEDVEGLCKEWNDDRIKYHRFPDNRGVPHGINFALSNATGEYIGILSADERIDLNKLLWQTGYLDEHSEIGGVWGLPQNGPVGERPEHEQYALKAHNRSREAWIRTLLQLENIPLGGASWLVRKSVLDDIGIFDEQFYTCSDLELFVRFFKKYEGRVFPYRWAWEEPNPNSLSRQVKPEDFHRDLAKVRAKHAMEFPPTEGRVTIAIPVKNMAQWIGATLDSILNQTIDDYEVMIVDDASADNLYEALLPYADMNLQLYKFDESRGPNAAQNHMLGMARTPFFVVLAADDTLSPDFLESCLKEFKADHWLEFVASQTDFINADGTAHTEPHPLKNIMKVSNKARDTWLTQMYYGNQYFGCGMYRTQAAKDVGGWATDVNVLADYDMYLKLLQRENIRVIERDLTHTRIHDAQRSQLKTRPEQQQLRQNYHDIRLHYYAPRMKVVIATPFYEMRGFSPYIASLAATVQLMTRLQIEHEFWELSGDSYVDRAKNTLFNKFLEDPDATDLFMIDSDMQWNPGAVLEMLQLPDDIVQGSYPQKNQWEAWTSFPQLTPDENGKQRITGRQLSNGAALIKAAALAGGFLRIKRSCLEKYKEHYKDYVYHDNGADPSYPERLYTEFFTCSREPGPDGVTPMRWGEDRIFGRRMQAIGIESWIYPRIDMGHYGVKGWQGNYEQYLKTVVEKPPEQTTQ